MKLESLGFSTANNGIQNRAVFQKAADCGGTITLTEPGIYRLADTVFLKCHTSLFFGAGVYLRREEDGSDENGPLFLNTGAMTQTWDSDITVTGMKVVNADVCCTVGVGQRRKSVTGIRAVLAFSFIRDLIIRDFETLDLPKRNFAIQVCTFENVLIENVHIEGRKDGLHFGRGRNFTVRHGIFRTFDDPIALNAHDYATSNPQLGWIENGIIEDCHDLAEDETDGYFCRILAGAWTDWTEGMEIQNSDTVVSEGSLYRAVMPPDGKLYRSVTRPTHHSGIAEYDGIRWAWIQDGNEHSCGCRNIVFRDIFLHKKRPVAFSIHFDKDHYSRSVYPYAEAPVQENLLFENVVCDSEIETFLLCRTPACGIRLCHSALTDTKLDFSDIGTEGVVYPVSDILISDNLFRGGFEIRCDDRCAADVQWASNLGLKREEVKTAGSVRMM